MGAPRRPGPPLHASIVGACPAGAGADRRSENGRDFPWTVRCCGYTDGQNRCPPATAKRLPMTRSGLACPCLVFLLPSAFADDFERGVAAFQQKDFKAAVDFLTSHLRKNPNDAAAY